MARWTHDVHWRRPVMNHLTRATGIGALGLAAPMMRPRPEFTGCGGPLSPLLEALVRFVPRKANEPHIRMVRRPIGGNDRSAKAGAGNRDFISFSHVRLDGLEDQRGNMGHKTSMIMRRGTRARIGIHTSVSFYRAIRCYSHEIRGTPVHNVFRALTKLPLRFAKPYAKPSIEMRYGKISPDTTPRIGRNLR